MVQRSSLLSIKMLKMIRPSRGGRLLHPSLGGFGGFLLLLAARLGGGSGLLGSLLRLEDLHHDLLLLDQEGANDSLSDGSCAEVSSVGSGHAFVPLGHVLQRRWPRGFDALQLDAGVAAYGEFGGFLLV